MTQSKSEHIYKPVLPVAEVVALEQRIAAQGTSLKELMARAGKALTQCVLNSCSSAQTTDDNQNRALIFTGSGNNGGDGWVVADLLVKEGWQVSVVCSKPASELKVEPARETALEIIAGWNAQSAEGRSATILVSPSEKQLKEELVTARVVVDGILGTGFSGTSIREPYASWIRLSNQEKTSREDSSSHNSDASNGNAPLLTVAADVPSGLSADTGSVANLCFIADKTVTMLAYKPGLILPESQQWTGKIILAPLI